MAVCLIAVCTSAPAISSSTFVDSTHKAPQRYYYNEYHEVILETADSSIVKPDGGNTIIAAVKGE